MVRRIVLFIFKVLSPLNRRRRNILSLPSATVHKHPNMEVNRPCIFHYYQQPGIAGLCPALAIVRSALRQTGSSGCARTFSAYRVRRGLRLTGGLGTCSFGCAIPRAHLLVTERFSCRRNLRLPATAESRPRSRFIGPGPPRSGRVPKGLPRREHVSFAARQRVRVRHQSAGAIAAAEQSWRKQLQYWPPIHRSRSLLWTRV
jgi:hypothetical protein